MMFRKQCVLSLFLSVVMHAPVGETLDLSHLSDSGPTFVLSRTFLPEFQLRMRALKTKTSALSFIRPPSTATQCLSLIDRPFVKMEQGETRFPLFAWSSAWGFNWQETVTMQAYFCSVPQSVLFVTTQGNNGGSGGECWDAREASAFKSGSCLQSLRKCLNQDIYVANHHYQVNSSLKRSQKDIVKRRSEKCRGSWSRRT